MKRINTIMICYNAIPPVLYSTQYNSIMYCTACVLYCTVLDCTPLYCIVQNHNWPQYWITIYWINTQYTQFCTVQYNTVQYSIMQNKIKSNLVIEQASDLNTIIFFHKSSLKNVYLNFDCPSGCGNLGNSFLQLQPIGRKIALPHSSNPNLPPSDTCPSTLFLTQLRGLKHTILRFF